jgi:glycosyltransferase involved in cell wall biosynthesis
MKSDEYARFMKDKDILTVPSSYEPFSLVTVEAMGLGVVPIVSSSVGAAELIENGRNGYIFELGNAAALAQVIQMLNGDRELLRDISARARESGRQLSWQNAAKDYLKLYAEIAGTE